MKPWAILNSAGELVIPTVYARDEAELARHCDMRGRVGVALSRALGGFETVTLAGEIVSDEASLQAHELMLADRGHLARHGAAAIVTAHVRKAIEAEAVLAGGSGRLLAAEAAARGITVEALARIVIAKDDVAIAAEVARVMAKAAAR